MNRYAWVETARLTHIRVEHQIYEASGRSWRAVRCVSLWAYSPAQTYRATHDAALDACRDVR